MWHTPREEKTHATYSANIAPLGLIIYINALPNLKYLLSIFPSTNGSPCYSHELNVFENCAQRSSGTLAVHKIFKYS